MRSKRYSNHPTITVLVQGVYASVFVQGTKDNQSSSVHSPSWARVFRAAFRTRAQTPLRIEPVHRSGMYAIERRWQTRLVVEQQQNETYDQLFSCSPVLHARNARNARNALTRPGFPLRRSPGAQTEADRAARAAAAEAAAARQERFETSAVGKAVKKSVKASKERPTAGRESAPISDYIS